MKELWSSIKWIWILHMNADYRTYPIIMSTVPCTDHSIRNCWFEQKKKMVSVYPRVEEKKCQAVRFWNKMNFQWFQLFSVLISSSNNHFVPSTPFIEFFSNFLLFFCRWSSMRIIFSKQTTSIRFCIFNIVLFTYVI